jgi:2-phospho-L-lactate guanylyltransferase
VPTVAVIPVRSFSLGKQRLAEALTPEQRSKLGKAMVEHVSNVVVESNLIPVLVTADPDVATWAAGRGIPSIPDPGEGLSVAASRGVDWAMQSGSRWLVLHSDLPMLSSVDLEAFGAATDGGDVIAPSSDGGTSAISSEHEIEFAFGPGSFNRHLARMTSPSVVARPGFLHDIDSPADLAAARIHPLGRWIEGILR